MNQQVTQQNPAPPSSSASTLGGSIPQSCGTIYKIVETSGLEGKNLLKLIPVSISSDKLTPLVYSDMSSVARGSISSPVNVSIQAPLSGSTTVPLVHLPILQHLNTGQCTLTRPAQNVAVESSVSSVHCSALAIDQPLLQNITVPSNQGDKSHMVVNANNIPAPMKSPALPSGHHLQIPAHAEVKTVPASSLPLAIQQKILAAAAASASGTQSTKMPTVIYVSPVNTVQTGAPKRLPTLYPKPNLSKAAPIKLATSQELGNSPAADVKTVQEPRGTPMKWVVHDSQKSEAPCLVPVRSSNNMASKILKTLADIKTTENSFSNMASFCANSTAATQTQMTPLKENALVMCNGKVYLLAKKGLDVSTTQMEKPKSSNIKTPEKPTGEIVRSDSVNQIASKVVDMVLSKTKSTYNADYMKTCIRPEIVLQPKVKKTHVLPQVLADFANQECQQRIVSTSGTSTNETCTMKTNYVAQDKNSYSAAKEGVLPENNENETMKTHATQYGTPVLLNVEEMPSSSTFSDLARDNLRKSLRISKEIKVCLERIPLDVIEGCSRKMKEHLKSGISRKEIDEVAFETNLHEIRKEVPTTLKPDICRKSTPELLSNFGNSQRSKSEESIHDNLKTASTSQPILHQTASQSLNVSHQVTAYLKPEDPMKSKPHILDLVNIKVRESIEECTPNENMLDDKENTKRSERIEECTPNEHVQTFRTSLPILHQTTSQSTSVLQQVTDHLKPVFPKARKTPVLYMVNTKRRESLEDCTPVENIETANTSLPMLEQTPSQSSNVLQQMTAEVPRKRKSELLDNSGCAKSGTSIEECTLNKDQETIRSSLPILHHASSNLFQQVTAKLNPELHKENKDDRLEDMVNKKKRKSEECIVNKSVENANTGKPMLYQTASQSSNLSHRVIAEYKPEPPNKKRTHIQDDTQSQETLNTEEENPVSQGFTGATSSNVLSVPQLDVDETIRDEKIRRLKDLLRERERALEEIRKKMKL